MSAYYRYITFTCKLFKISPIRASQALRAQEFVDDVVRACLVVVEIETVAGLWLNVGLEVAGGDFGKAFHCSCWN